MRTAFEIENTTLGNLMGGPANLEAVAAFQARRQPDFTNF
jgi:hypothetical protein